MPEKTITKETPQVSPIQIEGQKVYNGIDFPLVLQPLNPPSSTEETCNWIRQNKTKIEELLAKHACILFRGFELKNVHQFYDFILAFNWEFGSYTGGGGPRKVVLGPIETSTESPPEHVIPFHHELAYLTTPPRALFFWCEIEPKEQGQTPILLSNRIIEKLSEKNPSFIKQLQEKKVRYIRFLKDKKLCKNEYQRSWQDTFSTDDRSLAEQRAYQTGTEKVEWIEEEGEYLMNVTSIPIDAIRIDPRNQKPNWFNSIVLLHPASDRGEKSKESPWRVTYGDFSEMADSDVRMVQEIMNNEGTMYEWRVGDVLLVDNMLALHARNWFTPPRRILATIIK